MALNQQTLQGNWNQIKGKLHEKWGGLTDDELQYGEGNIEQLVGTIQQRTGESREAIEQYIEQLSEGSGDSMAGAGAAIRNYAGMAAESMQGVAQQATQSMHAGYEQTQEIVRHRPFESLLTCFGAGLITGVVVGFMCRSK